MRQTGDHGNGPALGETETSHAMPMSRKERQSTGRKLAEISATSFLMILSHLFSTFSRYKVIGRFSRGRSPGACHDERQSSLAERRPFPSSLSEGRLLPTISGLSHTVPARSHLIPVRRRFPSHRMPARASR